MAPHTITPAVGAVCRCNERLGLRRSPRGLHTRSRLSSLLRLNLDSPLKTTGFHSAALQFPRARNHSKRRRRWVGVKGSTCNGCRDSNCPSARCLRMVREGDDLCLEDEMDFWMRWSSRRLGCRRRPEIGFRVNDIPRIHWANTSSQRNHSGHVDELLP
ncbi:uncharacterized protein TNCV_742671 [Trichonephila clavipes]|nr:uncharacterized protein TNCV_742671 [Trichonephila clavipes]